MPRQENRADEQVAPSQPARALPSRAFKFTQSPSKGGRLAFVDVTINKGTFHLFNGLKVCSFVILKPSERGGPRRVFVPGHRLPGGQNFRHLQEDSGDLNPLQEAIRTLYEAKCGDAATAVANAPEDENLDEEDVEEAEMPF